MKRSTLITVAILQLLQFAHAKNPFCEDDKSREKYCHSADPEDIELCLSCYVGPSCPVPGQRGSLNPDGLFLLRGIADKKIQKLIVAMLNKKRLNEAWSRCVPLFKWDPDLASAAQAWADQCALVEYSSNYSGVHKLHHDPKHQRSSVLNGQLAEEPGVAQTVHWARTEGFDLNGKILEDLIESDLQIEDGLVDGLITNLPHADEDTNFVAFGQATHVGCGWIQFPVSSEAEDGPQLYENFMVCNYGVGLATKTTCDNMTKAEGGDGTMIKYYTVTSEVIKDVKSCLEAVRCRRRRRKLFKTYLIGEEEENYSDPCGGDVQQCLNGRSGLKFVDATKLRSVARSNDDLPIAVEAAKCKIDTILCSLNSTLACQERLEHCLPLIDIAGGQNVLCECSDLVLSDGTRGDCSQTLPDISLENMERPFCFVRQSPCVTIADAEAGGRLELSRPYSETNGLVHYSHAIC